MKEYYYTYDTIIGKLTFIERNNKLKELIFGNINEYKFRYFSIWSFEILVLFTVFIKSSLIILLF